MDKRRLICKFCNTEFFLCRSMSVGRKYCSRLCKTADSIGKPSYFKNKKHTKEARMKMRNSHKGHIPWNIGIPHTKLTKNKISMAKKGKKLSIETRKKFSILRTGKLLKGGKALDKSGYMRIYCPNHPNRVGIYVFEHRVIIENFIGRYLRSNEVVHHLGKKDDNRITMLMLFSSASAHQRFHKNPLSVKPEEIIFDGRKLGDK